MKINFNTYLCLCSPIKKKNSNKFDIAKIDRFVTDVYNLTTGNVFFPGRQKLLFCPPM